MFLSFFPVPWTSSLCVFVKCTGRIISFILQMSGIEYSKDKKFQLAYCKHYSEDEYGTVMKQLWLTLNNNPWE